MKRFIILSTILFTFFNCSVKEKPEFIGIENIKVLESTSNYITFSAEAKFVNPNVIGGVLRADAIKVYINDNEMATVSAENFNVPAQKEFNIPLKANVPTDSIFNDNNLSGLIGALLTKKVKVQYKGDINYTVLGFSYTYLVDKTEEVKFK